MARPLWEKKVGGVCAGFARHFDVDVTMMRILWLVIALITGVGFIAYLVAWIAMPAEDRVYVPNVAPGASAPAATDTPPPPGPRRDASGAEDYRPLEV